MTEEIYEALELTYGKPPRTTLEKTIWKTDPAFWKKGRRKNNEKEEQS